MDYNQTLVPEPFVVQQTEYYVLCSFDSSPLHSTGIRPDNIIQNLRNFKHRFCKELFQKSMESCGNNFRKRGKTKY